jgi:hypothetical protein
LERRNIGLVFADNKSEEYAMSDTMVNILKEAKSADINKYETNLFHLVDIKQGRPVFSTGPFLPITSSEGGNLSNKPQEVNVFSHSGERALVSFL